jgi:hypothetical protein
LFGLSEWAVTGVFEAALTPGSVSAAQTTACNVKEKKEIRRKDRQTKEWERKKGERKEEQNAKGIKKW